MNRTVRIEEVADINFDYPYLEVFFRNSNTPFMEIGITNEKELNFKFYPLPREMSLSIAEVEYIVDTAKEFFPKALKNEEDFQKFE